MYDALRSTVYGGRRVAAFDATTARLGQHDLHAGVVHIVVDGAGGVASSAHASDEIIGIIASDFLLQLPFQFLRDDTLHLGHDVGVGVGTHGGAHDVERVVGMAAPVANGLRAGVAERHVARANGIDRRSEHLHALHVGVLALHVGGSHEDLTLHVHQRAHCGGSHAMLSGTRFGDDACLAHLLRQQNLADGVVDFVCARMVEVLALEVELASILLAHSSGVVERRGAPHVIAEQRGVLALELLAANDGQVGVLQVVYALVENLRHIGASERSVETGWRGGDGLCVGGMLLRAGWCVFHDRIGSCRCFHVLCCKGCDAMKG